LGLPGAYWVAAVFAVHPMHVESVAWVTERKNVLSGTFALGSTLAYLKFRSAGSRRAYVASLVLFAGALLSKTATATLPVAIAIVDAWKSWPPRWKSLRPLAPFVLCAGAMALVTIVLEKGMVEVVSPDFALSPWHRVLVASRGLFFYPFKLLVPYPTIFNYPRFDVEHAGPTALWAPAAVVLVVLGLASLWHRGMRGLACAASIYAVTIFPALGFFDVYAFRFSFVADHFGYLASIPVLALLPWGRARGAVHMQLDPEVAYWAEMSEALAFADIHHAAAALPGDPVGAITARPGGGVAFAFTRLDIGFFNRVIGGWWRPTTFPTSSDRPPAPPRVRPAGCTTWASTATRRCRRRRCGSTTAWPGSGSGRRPSRTADGAASRRCSPGGSGTLATPAAGSRSSRPARRHRKNRTRAIGTW
jgi:hypothetical protein